MCGSFAEQGTHHPRAGPEDSRPVICRRGDGTFGAGVTARFPAGAAVAGPMPVAFWSDAGVNRSRVGEVQTVGMTAQLEPGLWRNWGTPSDARTDRGSRAEMYSGERRVKR